MLRITLKKKKRGNKILYLEGKISQEYISELHDAICEQRQKQSMIILDFEKVTYIDEKAVEMIEKFPPAEVQIRNCSLFICAMLKMKNRGE